MKKAKKNLLILISFLSLSGCLSTDDNSSSEGYDNVHSMSYGEKEENSNISDKLTLEAKVTNIINPIQGFKFSSVPIEGAVIVCTITDKILKVDMQEHNWTWTAAFDIIADFKGEVFPGYTIYSCPVKNVTGNVSNIELKINKNNTLEYLIIDGRTFSNSPLKTNYTKNTNSSLSLVKELDTRITN